jgi:transcriptional regulator with XRE-family HTH domain
VAKEPDDVSACVAWFGQRLRELREAGGLARKELAGRAGMRSEAGVRNLEQGIRSPSWETVLRLAAALGVSTEAFLQEPAVREAPGPGRPPKPKDASEAEKPKRPRGQPRKQDAAERKTVGAKKTQKRKGKE